jgi:hypothetical protein
MAIMDQQLSATRDGQQQDATSPEHLRQHAGPQLLAFLFPASVLGLVAFGALGLRRHPSGLEAFIILVLMGYLLVIGALVRLAERRL